MAVREVAKEMGKGVVYGVPPFSVSVSTMAGLTLQQWVYVVTIIYTTLLILKQFPKIYGCMVCFARNRTCNRGCRD